MDFSPGPDGRCETAVTRDAVAGDDVGLLLRRTPGPGASVASSGSKAGGVVGKPVNLATVSGAGILSLTPAQIAKLTPAQIAMMSAADFAKLSAAQKAALTRAQLSERTIAVRVRALKWESQIARVSPAEAKYLTAAQLGKVKNPYWMSKLLGKSGASLSIAQLKALDQKLLAANCLRARFRRFPQVMLPPCGVVCRS